MLLGQLEKNIFRLLEVQSISFVYRECHFNVRMIWFEVGIMLCEMKKQFRSTLRRHIVRVMHGALLILMGCVVGWAQTFVTVDKNIEVLGVPPVPTSLAAEVAPYSQIYGLPMLIFNTVCSLGSM